jgi:hypothetical protein
MVVHAYNPTTQEAKGDKSQVQVQLGLHSKTLSQKNKRIQLNEFKLSEW